MDKNDYEFDVPTNNFVYKLAPTHHELAQRTNYIVANFEEIHKFHTPKFLTKVSFADLSR